MTKLKDVLGSLPKNTPVWAVGLVCIMVTSAVSLTVVYVAVRPELKQVVTGINSHEEREDSLASSTVSSIIELIKVNEEQLVVLSQSLQMAQQQNIQLSSRVSALEKELAVSIARLNDCKQELNER